MILKGSKETQNSEERENIKLYKNPPLTISADKIHVSSMGYILESEDDSEFRKIIGDIPKTSKNYANGTLIGYNLIDCNEQGPEKITKKGSIIKYEFLSNELRGDKAMLILKCFSRKER